MHCLIFQKIRRMNDKDGEYCDDVLHENDKNEEDCNNDDNESSIVRLRHAGTK